VRDKEGEKYIGSDENWEKREHIISNKRQKSGYCH
jgi:hypothetical protein